MLSEGSVNAVATKLNIIIICEKSSQLLRCPSFSKNGILKLSTRGDHKYLKAYANPAQLNNVTVLLLMPALWSQTDRVEKTNKIGSPDENPKNNNFKTFFSKKIDIFFLFNLISPKRW